MPAALRMVKAEFGVDALVLNSRKNRRKGIMGIFSKPFVEVTAALAPQPPTPSAPQQLPEEEGGTTREAFQNSMLGPIARELKELREQVERLSQKNDTARDLKCSQPEKWRGGTEVLPSVDISPSINISPDKLGKFKKLLMESIAAKGRNDIPVVFRQFTDVGETTIRNISQENPLLAQITEELCNAGLAEEYVGKLLESLRPLIEQGAEREELDVMLAETLVRMIKCKAPLKKGLQGQRIIALVGPTGVGKTTTAAKLASTFRRKGLSVTLLTDDKRSFGALQSLRESSELGTVSLVVLDDLLDLEKTLKEHSEKDLILVDTAGRSHKDQKKLHQLKALSGCCHTVETHLCISATTRDRELQEIIAQYCTLPISGLAFTRMDESETFGTVLNAHLGCRIPISYYSTGVRIPEDIVIANRRKLANIFMCAKGNSFN